MFFGFKICIKYNYFRGVRNERRSRKGIGKSPPSPSGRWAFKPDPYEMAHMMIEHIDQKRRALGIDRAQERVFVDMAARRDLDAA